MKQFVFLAIAAVSLAQAQVQPEARALLEKAQAAHGAALKGLKGVSLWQTQVTQLNRELSSVRVSVDFASGSILRTKHYKSYLPSVSEQGLLAPGTSGGWLFNRPQVEPLTSIQQEELREELYGGVFVLAQLDKLEKAALQEPVEVSDLKVTPVQVSIGGFATTLLVGPDGLLVGQQFTPNLRTLYDGYRLEGGVRWPFKTLYQARSGSRWALVSTRALLEARLEAPVLTLNPKASSVFQECFCTSGLDLTEGTNSSWQITKVPADTAYARAGLRVGDVVIAVNDFNLQGQPTFAVDYLIMALGELRLQVRRGGQTLTIALSRQ